jgi:hypothetical protein
MAAANPGNIVVTTMGESMFTKRLLQMSVLYLIVGILLGIGMGMTENFTLKDVHAHLNLLGWATMGLMALIYKAYPDAAATTLAKGHFWLHSLGLPPLLIALTVMFLGNPGLAPVVGVFAIITGLGVIAFCINILRCIR